MKLPPPALAPAAGGAAGPVVDIEQLTSVFYDAVDDYLDGVGGDLSRGLTLTRGALATHDAFEPVRKRLDDLERAKIFVSSGPSTVHVSPRHIRRMSRDMQRGTHTTRTDRSPAPATGPPPAALMGRVQKATGAVSLATIIGLLANFAGGLQRLSYAVDSLTAALQHFCSAVSALCSLICEACSAVCNALSVCLRCLASELDACQTGLRRHMRSATTRFSYYIYKYISRATSTKTSVKEPRPGGRQASISM